MYLSIRDAMIQGEEFTSPLEGLRHLGVSAVEVALDNEFRVPSLDSRDAVTLGSDDDARAYKRHLDGLGVTACAFLTARDWSMGDPAANIRWVARAIELADLVGMSVVRIDSAMQRERELDFETRVRLFVEGLGGALERTAGSDVALGIENHGFQGNNLAFLLNVFQRVGSPRLGSTMDTGNFYWRGYPLGEVYGILALLAPYAKHTHLKNINYPAEKREETREVGWEYGRYASALEDGDIDHARVARMLRDAGYRGDLCIEDESIWSLPAGQARSARLQRDVAYVKRLLAELE